MISRLLLQPAFQFDAAKLRYLDNSLRLGNSSGVGLSGLSQMELDEVSRELELIQREMQRAQQTLRDVFQSIQSNRATR
jgi:hypothetical protein